MGEQDSNYSNPIFIVIMRNSRGKLFVYVAVLGVLCFIVFLLSSTRTSLKDLEGINEKCQQQRDSLSAQLQVVYEHKSRLEKSLQQEKTDHKHSKEANEKQASELENKFQKEKENRQKIENQVSQLKTSYTELEEDKTQAENALKQQLKTVQTQKDAEIEKLQSHISDLLSEKEKLEVSNNAFGWKLEQHASELSLCHLQLQQTKTELHTCQEQLKVHSLNTMNDKFYSKTPAVPKDIGEPPKDEHLQPVPEEKPAANQKKVVIPNENELLPQENQRLPEKDLQKVTEGKTVNVTSSPSYDKPVILEKPHVMQGNNMGDGVLPKPLDLNIGHANQDFNAEIVKEKSPNGQLSNRIGGIGVNVNNHPAIAQKREDMDSMVKANLNLQQDNHPQVAPPNFENVEEKDDHAAERGEDGIQYSNLDGKQQVEGPVLGRQNVQPKELFPIPQQENNDIVAQMQDMMNKSPGDVNHAAEQNVLGMPPHFAPADTKNQFKNENAFMHRGADGNRIIDDKNYEEDDEDDRDNDEPPNGLAPVLKANNILQDNDFDDQENQDNGDNAKEEEGVVVAPK